MRKNKIYWKSQSGLDTKAIVEAINRDDLKISIVERKLFKQKVVNKLGLNAGVSTQMKWINNNPLTSSDMFYVIQTVD